MQFNGIVYPRCRSVSVLLADDVDDLATVDCSRDC